MSSATFDSLCCFRIDEFGQPQEVATALRAGLPWRAFAGTWHHATCLPQESLVHGSMFGTHTMTSREASSRCWRPRRHSVIGQPGAADHRRPFRHKLTLRVDTDAGCIGLVGIDMHFGE